MEKCPHPGPLVYGRSGRTCAGRRLRPAPSPRTRGEGQGEGLGWFLLAAALAFGVSTPAAAQPPSLPPALAVEQFQLANGMRFLLVRRPELPSVAAGWVAHVGSVDERPGITGLTHFLEHMLFKGTQTIGARDHEKERLSLDEQERLQEAIRGEYSKLREKARRGELADPYGRDASTEALAGLEQSYARELERHRALTSPGELWRIYTEAGGKGLNALTLQDMTLYFLTLPAEKAELWFWMESDRLASPVFRDFYTERAVVVEERRQRTESTPTGRLDEQLKSLFWRSHPYGWPVLGWPWDLKVLSRADAEQHFASYYGPGNLTAVLVGNFDAAEVKRLAERYFGRLPARPAPPEMVSLPPLQLAEQRLEAACDCRPQVQALYQSVPFVHRDTAALEVLAGLLNGRTGRLFRALVLEQGIASSAFVLQAAQRWSGTFSFAAEAKGGARPADLLAAWDRELERLRREPVPEAELAKVKNQIAADAYRRLKEPSALLLQLLMADGFGDWQAVEKGPARALAVSAADVQRAVERYLVANRRTVGLYDRKPAGAVP